jgi:hypothetical protein
MTTDAPRDLQDWLRAAYSSPEASADAGCPPPEAYLEAESGALTADARRALDEHADRCPACAAERDLARLWDAAPEAAGARPEDVAFVVSRLEESSPVATPAAKVVPFRGPRPQAPPARSRSFTFTRLAAAAVLVLAAGLGIRTLYQPEPPLPAPQTGGAVRSAEIETLAPRGELEEIPRELRWNPWNGALSYRVRLIAVDGAVLWETTVSAPPARLPSEVTGRLHRAVSYTWTVEALGSDGSVLAASEPVSFRTKPQPEGPL